MAKIKCFLMLFAIALSFVMAIQNSCYLQTANGQTITDAEFFLDNDPGEGNGTPLLADDGVFDSANEQARIDGFDTSSLSIGSNIINVRFKDSNGDWGRAKQLTLEVNEVPNQKPDITAAEYFFDVDPGEGNGNSMLPTDGNFDGTTEEAFKEDINISGLSPGNHTVFVRFKDSLGDWSGKPKSTTIFVGESAAMEVTFEPNPIVKDLSGKWPYRILVQETNGIGLTITSVDKKFTDQLGNILGQGMLDTNQFVQLFDDCESQLDGAITAFDTACADLVESANLQPDLILECTFIGTDENGFSVSASGRVIFSSDKNVTPVPIETPTPVSEPIDTPLSEPGMTPEPIETPSLEPGATVTPEPETSAPTAEFEASVITGFEPLTVEFTDKSSGNPASWAWEFGDREVSSEQNPTHTYEEDGNYSVKLTVSNSKGSDVEEKLNLIAVKNLDFCVAAFNFDKTSGFAPLDVSFTDKSTGNPTSWAWEFGDGATSSEQNPTHSYLKAGIYTVKLTTGASCGSDTITQTNLINVLGNVEPTTEFVANPTVGFAPIDVQFSNLTAGDTTGFAWSFGDGGVSIEENPLHTYKNAGIYTVTLISSNGSGADIETKINLINILSGVPPTAEFEASPLTGFAPLNVPFTDTSSGNVANWSWDFGDGATSSLQNPVHDYKSPGFYNVKLIVSGQDGTGLEEKINLINVLDGQGPTAAFFAEPLTGNAPFTVHFFDVSSGDIANTTWQFGDGELSIDQNPVHTFKSAGTFNVKLTVSGKDGTSTETKTGLITVISGTEPSAGFTVDKQTRTSSDSSNELTVQFSDASSTPSGVIVNRLWDFGDRTFSSEENPEHTYIGSSDDVFSVSLTVQDSKGANTVTKSSFISLEESAGDADVTPTPGEKSTGLKVSPSTAGNSLRKKRATLSLTNENGEPMSDVTVVVSTSGDNTMLPEVSPETAVTDANGEVKFEFRFPFRSQNGEITFTANGETVTITQE